jgi:chromosome segregation ATPase
MGEMAYVNDEEFAKLINIARDLRSQLDTVTRERDEWKKRATKAEKERDQAREQGSDFDEVLGPLEATYCGISVGNSRLIHDSFLRLLEDAVLLEEELEKAEQARDEALEKIRDSDTCFDETVDSVVAELRSRTEAAEKQRDEARADADRLASVPHCHDGARDINDKPACEWQRRAEKAEAEVERLRDRLNGSL